MSARLDTALTLLMIGGLILAQLLVVFGVAYVVIRLGDSCRHRWADRAQSLRERDVHPAPDNQAPTGRLSIAERADVHVWETELPRRMRGVGL